METQQQVPPLRPQLRSFVRRGDRMTAAQQHAWDHFGDSYRIEVERDTGDTSVAPGQSLIPAVVFGREAPLVVEIGTGNGEALLHAATAHPEMDFLGIEVYRPGLA